MNLYTQITNFCTTHNLIKKNSTIIVGLSGGPDSVFLLHFLHSIAPIYNLFLVAAHLDHEWRPTAAQDRDFCKELAQALQLTFISEQLSNLPSVHKYNGSKEEWARNKRRQFFKQIRTYYPDSVIALAHHADDQEETFFIRMIRGTTLSGLTAMYPRHNEYIRPLLATAKKDIMAYLYTQSIAYVTDQTNQSNDFLRNRLRNNVLPTLHATDKRFEHNFKHTLHHLQQADQFINSFVAQALAQITHHNQPETITIPLFFSYDPFIQYHLLVVWLCNNGAPFVLTHSFLQEIIRFLKQPGTKDHQLHPQWKIKKQKESASICFL